MSHFSECLRWQFCIQSQVSSGNISDIICILTPHGDRLNSPGNPWQEFSCPHTRSSGRLWLVSRLNWVYRCTWHALFQTPRCKGCIYITRTSKSGAQLAQLATLCTPCIYTYVAGQRNDLRTYWIHTSCKAKWTLCKDLTYT